MSELRKILISCLPSVFYLDFPFPSNLEKEIRKWARGCVPPEDPNTDQDGVYRVNEFRKQVLKNIEEE